MAVYHGKKGRVYMSTTGTGAAVSVGSLTSWSIDSSTDTVEVTAFGDVNKAYVQGLPDLSGTFEGFWNDTDATLFTGASSSDGVKLYLYPSSDATTKYWYGPAWVSYSVNTGVSEAVAISANFVANGAWGRQVSIDITSRDASFDVAPQSTPHRGSRCKQRRGMQSTPHWRIGI